MVNTSKNSRGSTKEADQLACEDKIRINLEVAQQNTPFGPKVPWDVLGSAKFLLFLKRATVRSLDLRVMCSSSSEDSESIGGGWIFCSSVPNVKYRRQGSKQGRLRSRMIFNLRSISARVRLEISGLRSTSIVGVPSG